MFAQDVRQQNRRFESLFAAQDELNGDDDTQLFRSSGTSSSWAALHARQERVGESLTNGLSRLTGSRRRGVWLLFSLFSLLLLLYAALTHGIEQRAHAAVVSKNTPSALPYNTNNNTLSDSLTPTHSPTHSPTQLFNTTTNTTVPTGGESDNSSSSSSTASLVSLYASIAFSLLTWVAVLQTLRYLRQRQIEARIARSVGRERGGAGRAAQGEVELLHQFLVLSHLLRRERGGGGSGGGAAEGERDGEGEGERLARRWRLAIMQRDFTGDDYDLLQQLDELHDNARRGAPQRTIDTLPTHSLTAEELALSHTPLNAHTQDDHSGAHSCCNICLAPYEAGEVVRTLPCLHRFHRDCIDPWLHSNGVCPVCKHSVTAESGDETLV